MAATAQLLLGRCPVWNASGWAVWRTTHLANQRLFIAQGCVIAVLGDYGVQQHACYKAADARSTEWRMPVCLTVYQLNILM